MIALLLLACDLPPSSLTDCRRVDAGYEGTIEGADRDGLPAYVCEAFWYCREGSWYAGELYGWGWEVELEQVGPGTWSEPASRQAEADRLWCDRCGWANGPALLAFEVSDRGCTWSDGEIPPETQWQGR